MRGAPIAGAGRGCWQFVRTSGGGFSGGAVFLVSEESSEALGKTAGKDQAQKKATYPALHGLEVSRDIAADLEAKALNELELYRERAGRLRQLAQFLVARRA